MAGFAPIFEDHINAVKALGYEVGRAESDFTDQRPRLTVRRPGQAWYRCTEREFLDIACCIRTLEEIQGAERGRSSS